MKIEEKKFPDISEKQKRKLIKIIMMSVLHQTSKTESVLRQKKERTKQFVFQSDSKEFGLKQAERELEYIDTIADYIIENRDSYSQLPVHMREKQVLEELAGMGFIMDLSILNNPDLLLTDRNTGKKEINYGRYSEEKRYPIKLNYQGREIQLTKVGKMNYTTTFMVETYIEEYLVQDLEGEAEVFTSDLDIEKIKTDEQYRKLFFEQLISKENINIPNGNGYIGSIVNIGDSERKYGIEYSDEEYTAVTELKNRLREKDEDNPDR